MDKDKLKKFIPVLNSPFWIRLEEEVLQPHLDKLRDQLEIKDIPEARGKIQFIRMLLDLKKNALTMLDEKD